MRRLFTSLLSLALFLPLAARAHPHVFVDAKLRLQINEEGVFEGIEVAWTYDDFYSLLLLADMGLTPDAQGGLEHNQLVLLDGFDLQWIEGFAGDTIAARDGEPVTLGPPEGRGIKVEDGLITSTHFRAATGPADGLVIKAFDPTFYTAYSLIGPVDVSASCRAIIQTADLDAAYTMVEELLYATPSAEAEDDYPEVGEAFADTVFVTCAP
ncbi:DUF1007 family protein [Tateyamaria pelophila]|uniref:DUF1007 family protein n=1 Tax=Tateyamaria pelophila TaxID=328415 RepID=UPI001CBAC730|nr:DUF1007 family protein [Tateyamaria pelophila]